MASSLLIPSRLIAAALGIILLLILFYLFLRLLYTPAIMSIKDLNLKKGLQATWKFSYKKLASTFLLLVAIGLVDAIIRWLDDFIYSILEIFDLEMYERKPHLGTKRLERHNKFMDKMWEVVKHVDTMDKI